MTWWMLLLAPVALFLAYCTWVGVVICGIGLLHEAHGIIRDAWAWLIDRWKPAPTPCFLCKRADCTGPRANPCRNSEVIAIPLAREEKR